MPPRAKSQSNQPRPQPRAAVKVAESPRRSRRNRELSHDVSTAPPAGRGAKSRLPKVEEAPAPTTPKKGGFLPKPTSKGRGRPRTQPVPDERHEEASSGSQADQSDHSGENAPTPRSVEIARSMAPRSDELIEQILDLRHETVEMLRLLLPSSAHVDKTSIDVEIVEILAALNDSASTHSRRLRARASKFDEVVNVYSTEGYSIDPSIVIRAIFKKEAINEISIGPWRPDDLLYDANLAGLARTILTLDVDSDNGKETMQQLDNSFPGPFFSSLEGPGILPSFSSQGSSKLLDITMSVAIGIRTQLVIMLLRAFQHTEELDPEQILQDVYYQSDDPRLLKGWGNAPGLGKPMLQDLKAAALLDVQDIREAIDGREVEFAHLENRFPWSDFVIKIINFIQARHEEINSNIRQCGGAEAIRDQLHAKLESGAADDGDGRGPAIPDADGVVSRAFSGATPASYLHLQKRKQRLQPAVSLDGPRPDAEDDEGVGSSDVIVVQQDSTTNQQKPTGTRSSARQGKLRPGKALYNAPRAEAPVSPISENPNPTQDLGFQATLGGRQTRKRTAVDNSSTAEPSQAKRRREATEDAEYEDTAHDGAQEVSSRGTANTSSVEAYHEAVVKSRQISSQIVARAREDKPPQVRTAWTEAESMALIDYIGREGAHWAKIKEKDGEGKNLLRLRGQVSLKDRARNMKYNYLMAGVPLPDRFEAIQLDKKLIEKLAAAGIDYEQARLRVIE